MNKYNYFFSIITVCRNSTKNIRQTFDSVLSQSFHDYEYIVIDGVSTDGTIDIIREYEPKFEGRMRWVSEPDSGIYDAINKGIRLSKGRYLGLAHSDDWYAADSLATVAGVINNDPTIDVVYGNIYYIHNDKFKLRVPQHDKLHSKTILCHPTCFMRRELFNEKLYDTSYKISADYDLILYFRKRNKKFLYLNKTLVYARSGGASSNNKLEALRLIENFKIQRKYFHLSRAVYNFVFAKSESFLKGVLKLFIPKTMISKLRGYKEIN